MTYIREMIRQTADYRFIVDTQWSYNIADFDLWTGGHIKIVIYTEGLYVGSTNFKSFVLSVYV